MGLAATQTRFLSLTARKSNVEYQGQQINQQRTVLSNKSANLYSEMLTLAVPIPPSTADFTSVKYKCVIDQKVYYIDKDNLQATNDGKLFSGTLYKDKEYTTPKENSSTVYIVKDDYDRFSKFSTTSTDVNDIKNNGVSVLVYEETDNGAYQDAYNQYLYRQYLYEQEMEAINAKTEIIQQQDKALELQLSQLDTEQNEIKTEMEALDKVLGDNVEGSYKTFGG